MISYSFPIFDYLSPVLDDYLPSGRQASRDSICRSTEPTANINQGAMRPEFVPIIAFVTGRLGAGRSRHFDLLKKKKKTKSRE
jgi:hypothetical protein